MEEAKKETLIQEIKEYMEVEKYQEAFEAISKLNDSFLKQNLTFLEYKVFALIELGKIEEAKKLSLSLPLESPIRNQVCNLFKITQNKPTNMKDVEALKALEEFGLKNGLYKKKASIVYFENGLRGLIANSKIKKGEIIFKIPEQMLLHTDIAKEGETAVQIGNQLISFLEEIDFSSSSDFIFIVIFILEQKQKPNSFWKPYLDSLSYDVSSFPLFYNDHEKSLCKGTKILEYDLNKMNEQKKTYDFICQNAPNFACNSFSSFIEFYTIFRARWFSFLNKEGMTFETSSTALCPFLDIANFHPVFCMETDWHYDIQEKAMIFQALEDIEIGEQIYSNYHKEDPLRLLQLYGFIDPCLNSFRIEVPLQLNELDSFYQDKKKLISSIFNYISEDEEKVLIEFRNNNAEESKIYFQTLRLLLSKKPMDLLLNEFPCFKQFSEMVFSECPIFLISIENELEVFNWIKDTFSKELHNFHPFWDSIYDSKKLSFNESNIEYIVKLQKKLCDELIDMAESGIRFVNSNFKENMKYSGEFIYFYDQIKEYSKAHLK